MATTFVCGVQALLVLTTAGAPVRLGVPLPAAAVAQGLRLEGPGALQWRRLPVGGLAPDPVWVEIGIAGAGQRARIAAGGAPACPDGRGPAFVREQAERALPEGRLTSVRWRWCDGSEDEIARTVFHAACIVGGEPYAAGEARTVVLGGAPALRAAPAVHLPRRLLVSAGLLPPGGRLGEPVRRQLALARPRLCELPGALGAGDYARGDGTVTNLEYDTALALLRLALADGSADALAQAQRSAVHLADHDLDLRTGLPFPHGPGHRTGVPDPGHAWLQGLLYVGLLTADDGLIGVAAAIARGLAAHPPSGEGRQELARDYAWPLLELESFLAVSPDAAVAAAADRLAASIDRRFHAGLRTYRFGEGELGGGDYLERAWITGGIVVPALQAHLDRRPDPTIAAHVQAVRQGLLDRIGTQRSGLPVHWRLGRGRDAEHRAVGMPEALLLLEAFPPADLRRLLRRGTVREAVAEVPRLDDLDLATSFTMVARCTWVWR
ncbi:MAG: hypothetical protein FJ265_07955 [Planctomycetes bacterium]|nr:hypothetical protein [Planctomycetota bacterium]